MPGLVLEGSKFWGRTAKAVRGKTSSMTIAEETATITLFLDFIRILDQHFQSRTQSPNFSYLTPDILRIKHCCRMLL